VETIASLVSQHGAASAAHVNLSAAPSTAPRSWEPKLQLADVELQAWLEACKQQLGPALVAVLLNKLLP
jgi:phage baseplate assembly protein W